MVFVVVSGADGWCSVCLMELHIVAVVDDVSKRVPVDGSSGGC